MSNSPDLNLGWSCGCACTEECPCGAGTYAAAVRKVDLEGMSARGFAPRML